MKRFLMLVAVAAVAGAMYVAAAPGGQQATAPTAAQFATLKKQVTKLTRTVTALKKDEAKVKKAAGLALGFLEVCYFDSNGQLENLPVTQFGDTGTGFLFGTSTSSAPRSALDIDTSGSPRAFLQEITPGCLTSTTALRHGSLGSDSSRLQRWAERTR
ncbi:MAG: hypothetical protein ACJ75G_12985 [Gaiellaceae bacterium]